jgi:hypothetical protein
MGGLCVFVGFEPTTALGEQAWRDVRQPHSQGRERHLQTATFKEKRAHHLRELNSEVFVLYHSERNGTNELLIPVASGTSSPSM